MGNGCRLEAGTLLRKPFATKSPERLIAETEDRNEQLKKGVGSLDIVALGIGGTIGTGVFVIIGEAIGTPGRRSSSASSSPG